MRESQKLKAESQKVDVFFVPTVEECKRLFPGIELSEWKYGILSGTFQGKDLFITGISKTNVAFSAAHILDSFSIAHACLIGIAGAYRNCGLHPGDLVCTQDDCFVDEGMVVDGVLSLTSEMGFPVCPDNRVQFDTIEGLTAVSGNTVSWLSSSDELAAQYHQKTGAAIESMEGAAFGLATSKMGVRFSQVRAISNYCGARDQQEWDIKAAFKSLQNWITQLSQ